MADPAPQYCLLKPANCTANVAVGGFGSLIWRLVGNMRRSVDGECGVTGFGATNSCPHRPKVGFQMDDLLLVGSLAESAELMLPKCVNSLVLRTSAFYRHLPSTAGRGQGMEQCACHDLPDIH